MLTDTCPWEHEDGSHSFVMPLLIDLLGGTETNFPYEPTGKIAYKRLMEIWYKKIPTTPKEEDQYVRCFLLYTFGCILFCDSGSHVQLDLLPSLVDIDEISSYDWGSASLAHLYYGLSRASRKGLQRVNGFAQALEVKYLNKLVSLK